MGMIQTSQRELEAFYAMALPGFLDYLKVHGTSVDRVEMATTIEGITSLPGRYCLGGVEKNVLVPMKLLTKDVDVQIEACQEASVVANTAAEIANAAAQRVETAIEDVNTVKQAALEAAASANSAVSAVLEAMEATRMATQKAESVTAEAIDATDKALRAAEVTEETDRKVTLQEQERLVVETSRVLAESKRCTEESLREEAEVLRNAAEQERIAAETRRTEAETQRTIAEQERNVAEIARKEAETVRSKAAAVQQQQFEQTIVQTTEVQKAAILATANAKSVSDHPGYIGEDYHVYVWDYVTETYNKTATVLRPEGFNIYRTYPSVETMEADLMNVPEGKFVLINTNDVEVPDNAKLYVRGAASFEYLVDMSGAIGFTGKTPQITIGNVTVGSSASATLSPDGFDEDGNPMYKLNLVVVPGPRGFIPLIETGTVTTGEAGGEAAVDLLPNGQTEDGRDKYLLNFVIPQGLPGEGFGNLAVDPSGVLTGKKYLLMFSRDGMPESGTLIEYVDPIIPKKTSDLENDCDFIDTAGVTLRIGTHDGDPGAHGDIRQRITDVEAIARGKSRAKIFDTVDELDEWLSKEENTLLLQKGDNFYIRDKGVPDYWWDGTAKQELEVEKVDLSVFYDKGTSDKRFSFKPLQKTAVLLPGSWIEDEEKGLWWQEVEDGDVREGCFLEAWPVDKKSADEAINIHIYENMPVTDGRFRVAAEKKASEAINITYTIIK